MSSLIANKVKTNMCLVSLSLIVHTTYVSHRFQLIQRIQQQDYNNNCLFDILLI